MVFLSFPAKMSCVLFQAPRQEVVIATYEARPMPDDHDTKSDFENFHHPIS